MASHDLGGGVGGRFGGPRQPNGKRPLSIPAAIVAGALLLGPGLVDLEPRLVWNISPSAPRGLYWVSRPSSPSFGEYAAARLAPDLEELAAQRRYLPRGIPLIKKVAAVTGDEVCASGDSISVFGRTIARRRETDPSGRSMPWWTGCRRLGAGELLLLNANSPHSFDGRYFGPTGASEVIGKATLLWRR